MLTAEIAEWGADVLIPAGQDRACRSAAGFVMVNGAKTGHSCAMKIVDDFHGYAPEQDVSKEESLALVDTGAGAEVYAKV